MTVSHTHQAETYRELLRPSRLGQLSAREILLHASRFSRIEPTVRPELETAERRPLRVSLLSTLSSQHFSSILKLFLYAEGLMPTLHAGEFDGIALEGFSPESNTWQSNPDVLIILPAIDDIKSWPDSFADTTQIDSWVQNTAKLYLQLWQFAAQHHPHVRIYQAGFVAPLERPLGNLETACAFSRTRCLQRLNDYLLQQRHANVTLVDLDGLSGQIGKLHWFDETAYFTSKQPFSLRVMPAVAAYLARIVASGQGRIRKCLVLDLDNTLWGGIIGDDGLPGIRLDPADPAGEAFRAFQRYLLVLKQRGILLAVCSKNEHAIAASAFTHENMLLSLDDFSAFVANWDDKATNLRLIAEKLNIGMDALVFFDDNPAERAIVEQFTPEVLVVDVPEDPALFVRALELSHAFEWPQLTAEDIGRTASYLQDRKREELQEQFADYDSYLRSLGMRAWIEPANAGSMSRIAQLVNKTNQFNLRTQRYGEEEIAQMLSSPDYEVLQARFEDRFSQYGIMACVVLRFSGKLAFIENWVMSCRVFKRGLEEAMLNAIIEIGRARNCRFLVGEYIATAKNRYVANMFENFGFDRWNPELLGELPGWLQEGSNGILFHQDLSAAESRKHVIEIMDSRTVAL